MPYQCHSSSADCARELFKGSNGLASLLDCTRKKIFLLGTSTRSVALTSREKFSRKATCVSVFFFRKSPKAPGCQSVKPSIGFLVFLIQKLWPKNNKKSIINYLIRTLINYCCFLFCWFAKYCRILEFQISGPRNY